MSDDLNKGTIEDALPAGLSADAWSLLEDSKGVVGIAGVVDFVAQIAALVAERDTARADRDAWSSKCAELTTELGRLRVVAAAPAQALKSNPFRDHRKDPRRLGLALALLAPLLVGSAHAADQGYQETATVLFQQAISCERVATQRLTDLTKQMDGMTQQIADLTKERDELKAKAEEPKKD